MRNYDTKLHETDEKFLGHVGCDSCGSSDANAEYERHYFCFNCSNRAWKDDDAMNDMSESYRKPIDNGSVDEDSDNKLSYVSTHTKIGPLKDRNISIDTCKHYQVRVTVADGLVSEHWYPYTNPEGDLTSYKKRIVEGKKFTQMGNTREAVLFGQSTFSKVGKFVTICEGEVDTMSAFQMNGSKFAHVGVSSSASAYKDCKKQYEYLNSFENIIVCMDNDDAGKKAANLVASLFPKKAKIIKLTLNDPSEYLSTNKESEFVNAWWRAEKYQPDDILSGFDAMWEIAKQPRREALFQYPWEGLNEMTYGLRPTEMVVITAGSGIGKTQFLREIAHHALKTTEENIGVIYLEESAFETGMGMASIEGSKPFHLPDIHYTQDELKSAYQKTWGTDRIHSLRDTWRENTIEYIGDKIKFLSKGMDCRLIILDHLSFMVSDNPGDERKMLDEIAHRLKALAVELDICLLAVCHSKRQSGASHEEGAKTKLSDLRGTAGIGQLSNIVIGVERNGQAPLQKERDTSQLRVLKNRFSGKTGPSCRVLYDQYTGRLTEIPKSEYDEDEEDSGE